MSKKSEPWKDKVRALPQFDQIPDEVSSLWIERASRMDPEDRDRLIDYMARIDADDMGAFLAHNRKRWHPHTTPANVVRTKLLAERPKSEPAYKARRRQMTPLARDLMMRQVESLGATMRPDLADKVLSNKSSEHPWLRAMAIDIIEENGKLVLVEYRTPAEPLPMELRGISFHHEVSLHYALLAARKAGVKVDGLRLCAMDIKSWTVETSDLHIDDSLVEEIATEGDRVWRENIVPAKQMVSSLPQGVASLDDLRSPDVGASEAADQLNVLAEKYLSWGVAEQECSGEREDLQVEAADLLPFAALPLEVERVDAGPVRFRIEREYDKEGLAALAVDLLVRSGNYTVDEARSLLEQPNYWTNAEYSSRGLIQALETHFGLDPENDRRFAMALAVPRERRVDALLDLIRSLDQDETIPLQGYVRSGQLRMEMVPPRARYEREARAAAASEVRSELRQILDGRRLGAAPEPQAKRASRRP